MIGPFLVLLVLMYFLYPHINEEKYEQIVSEMSETETEAEWVPEEPFIPSREPAPIPPAREIPAGAEDGAAGLEQLMVEQSALQAVIDSLNSEKEHLLSQIEQLHEELERSASAATLQASADMFPPGIPPAGMEQTEEFADRVKSLLNLDEEELAPIIRQLTQDQLVRLYNSAGNIQREKLLRSLSPDRAAKLMEMVML